MVEKGEKEVGGEDVIVVVVIDDGYDDDDEDEDAEEDAEDGEDVEIAHLSSLSRLESSGRVLSILRGLGLSLRQLVRLGQVGRRDLLRRGVGLGGGSGSLGRVRGCSGVGVGLCIGGVSALRSGQSDRRRRCGRFGFRSGSLSRQTKEWISLSLYACRGSREQKRHGK